MCCFIVWIWDFIKKLRYLKSKISTKFHRLLFLLIFLAFLAFCFLFHLSKLVKKLWNFLWWFIGRVRDFTNNFWKILKVLLKKILICKIFYFSKFCSLLFVFLIFYYFLHFIFNFVYLYLSKNCRNFYVFLFYGLEILSKNLENHGMFFKKI